MVVGDKIEVWLSEARFPGIPDGVPCFVVTRRAIVTVKEQRMIHWGGREQLFWIAVDSLGDEVKQPVTRGSDFDHLYWYDNYDYSWRVATREAVRGLFFLNPDGSRAVPLTLYEPVLDYSI